MFSSKRQKLICLGTLPVSALLNIDGGSIQYTMPGEPNTPLQKNSLTGFAMTLSTTGSTLL